MKARLNLAALTVLTALLSGIATAGEPPAMPTGLPPYGPDRPLPAPTVVTDVLPNGLTVWIVPRPGFPRLSAELALRGGSAAEPREVPGLASVLASTLKEGTTARTARQIAETMQGAGGEIDVRATADAILVSGSVLSTGAATLIEVLADVATHPSFPPEEVALVKENTLQGLLAQESTPEFAVEKAFFATVYGEHPYHVTTPTAESVAKVTPQLLKSEHGRLFRPDRALLVVAGAVEPTVLKPLIRNAFSGWKKSGQTPPATPPGPAARGSRVLKVIDRPGSVQSEIRVGGPTARATDPDFHAMVVANTIFGGSFASRLTENIREDKGYTYTPDSAVEVREQGGLLRVEAAVRTEVTAGALLEIFYELDRMGATFPTEEELARAKRYQSGLYLLANSLNDALASTLARGWVNGLPPAALAEFIPRINAVTVEEVRRIGQKTMASGIQTVVVGGDGAQLVPVLAQFGTVTVLRP